MKLLAILGSPRRGGNAEVLLDKLIMAAQSTAADLVTEKIVLNGLKFSPCQECGGCERTGRCVLQDAMQDVYQKIFQADMVVIASPIFFGSLPAQVKAMIDRYQCRWVARYVLMEKEAPRPKKGVLILVEGSTREDFFQNAESIVKNFFAVSNIKLTDKLYCPGLDKKAQVLEDLPCLKKAAALGEKLLADKGGL